MQPAQDISLRIYVMTCIIGEIDKLRCVSYFSTESLFYELFSILYALAVFSISIILGSAPFVNKQKKRNLSVPFFPLSSYFLYYK